MVGSGLIGTSFALALKRHKSGSRGASDIIWGYDENSTHAHTAKSLGAFDEVKDSLEMLAEQCDILVLAVPISASLNIFSRLAQVGREELIITDVASVKRPIINNACQAFGTIPTNFIPGHPLAGTEKSGPRNASATLFKDCRVLLTPLQNNAQDSIDVVAALWKSTGAKFIELMPPERHDKLLADLSHLPHIAAYALMDCLLLREEADFAYAAGGLRDFTRIAESDPVMWRDIFLSNADCVLSSISYLEQSLKNMRTMIEENRHEELRQLLQRIKELRNSNLNNS